MTRSRFDADAPVRPDGDPLTMARAFCDEISAGLGGSPLKHWRGDFYCYDRVVYRRVVPECLRSQLYHFLEQQRHMRVLSNGRRSLVRYHPNTYRVSDVRDALAAICQVNAEQMPCWLDNPLYRPAPTDLICFQNGLLDLAAHWSSDGLGLLAPTPDWFSENVLPYVYCSEARCDCWMAFLHDVLDGDEERIKLLQEWVGYCLTPDTSQQKGMLMVGLPRSGKGTIIRTIQRVIGAYNCASLSLSSLGERFGLSPLLGKRVALCPDAHLGRGSNAVAVLEKLKSIIGEDAQCVDRKNREALANVRLGVRFTIAVNEIPRLPDASVAMRSRLLLMPFGNTYEGREDRQLDQRLCSSSD